jgi:hypothetical protein
MPGDRNLNIRLTYDTGPADASSEAYNKRAKARITELLTAEQVAEKAKQELVKQSNAAKIRDAVAAGKTESTSAKVTAEELIAARGRVTSATLDKIRQEQAARQNADDNAKRNARIRHDIEMFQMSEHHNKMMAAWDDQQKLNNSIGGSIKSAIGFGAAMVGLQSAQSVIGMFTEHFARIRQYAAKTADEIQRMREGIRELQALRGEMGETGKGIAHTIGISGQTMQTPEEVKEMLKHGLSTGAMALGKGPSAAMTEEEFDQLMIGAGKFQAMEGGNAGIFGDLAGLVALESKGKLTPEEGEARIERLFHIQIPGRFPVMSQAVAQYAKNTSLVMNDIYTPEELMGLTSAFSISGPEESATKVQQFTRSVMAGRVKARGMAVSPDVDFEKTSEYFKGLGITDQDSAIERGKKIAKDLQKQKSAAQAAGKRFPAHEYLIEHGFGNMQDREAIMDFSGMLNTGRLEKIEAAQNEPLVPGAITKRFSERTARDPFFAARGAEISEEAADIKRGSEVEDMRAIKRAAFSRLKAQGKVSGDFKEFEQSWNLDPRNLFHGDRRMVTDEARDMIIGQAKQAGIAGMGDVNSPDFLPQGPSDESMRRAMARIRDAGGNPTGGAAGDIASAAASLKAAAAALEKQTVRQPVPAPMPGKPPPAQMRVQ